MTIEMPWVIETRLEPGQKRKRNPTWGILAGATALLNGIAFIVGFVALFTAGSGAVVFGLPVWGIITLAALGCSVAAITKRGGFNVGIGWVSLGVVVLTNPLTVLIAAMLLGV